MPLANWRNTSCPNVVVPNQKSADGGAACGPTYSLGPWSVNSGATSPSTRNARMTTSAPITFGLRSAK